MTKEDFLRGVSNWDNHRILLWDALQLTKDYKFPVLELGCGDGSTPFLREYCLSNDKQIFSYDYSKEWAERFGAIHVSNWDHSDLWGKMYSVALVDESPGEHRKESLGLLKKKAIIVVAHDTEPAADHGYQMRRVLGTYKYMRDHRTEGAWATIVSDYIDVR